MSRQIAPQTRSKALSRTKRVLDARQGMEGAKNAYRGSQEVKRADTPNQGLSVIACSSGMAAQIKTLLILFYLITDLRVNKSLPLLAYKNETGY
ncbi:hypothetical protein [Escherichia coli]|nr:hypothetical protein [Escherichia coli]